MTTKLDFNRIARGLGAKRRGTVEAQGGYFGALELAADIGRQLRTPVGGGRPTNPAWTERRLIGLAPETLRQLEVVADEIGRVKDLHLNAMQVAAILLERAVSQLKPADLTNDLQAPPESRPKRTRARAA